MPTIVQDVVLYPPRIIAGDVVELDISLPDYPASLWALTYTLSNSAAAIDWTAGESGDDYELLIPSSTTKDYLVGEYRINAYATETSSSNRTTIGEGVVSIEPDLAVKGAYDTRSNVKKVLDAIDATILGTASSDQQAYTIQGRSLSRRSMEELLKLRAYYTALYEAELNAADIESGKTGRNLIKTWFTRN